MNTTIAEAKTVNHPVVSSDRWVSERKTLLAREKELTRLHDQIARERRALPWERDENDVPYKMEWVRHHDRYEPTPTVGSCCDAHA